MSGTQQPEALRLADKYEVEGFLQDHRFAQEHWCRQAAAELRRQHARIAELEDAADIAIKRIAELEEQLSAIGAGGVEPLRKQAVQAAVQAEVPEAIEQMAVERYKVVPSHESMFHRWAVVAGNGTQQLYIGREVECLNMARKFTGAFLDGAFLAMQNTAPAHPAEGVPAQAVELEVDDLIDRLLNAQQDLNLAANVHMDQSIASASTLLDEVEIALRTLAATQPAAQGMDAETQRHAAIGKAIERACADLPEETEIIVSLEKDAGTVTMIDQDGNEHENFSCDHGFAGVLNEAIDAAMTAQARNKKGIEQ